ncbi:ParB N-terminal domain-containing protein [Actinomadura vinacea]|uniref:ParB N-terminal domain-containing protein n=1 Tax=Actinomadura vinacea TaxID=115336 RepID=A0ABP5XJS5_9ACTN
MQSAHGQFDLQEVEEVELSSLSTAGSPRIAGESHAHVETLAGSQAPLPPIIVHRPTMRVIDGMHRVLAARRLGRGKIAVRYFDGPEEDAFVLAVRSNIAHGLPLSLADRKHAAERVIASHPQWSDRMIASVTGISAKTVAEIRRNAGAGSAAGPDRLGNGGRIGKDGRVRSVDVTQARRRAQELIVKDPGLSLRQVARAVGISPETARDVRNRLSLGEDPLPQGRSKETADRPAVLRPGAPGDGRGPAGARAPVGERSPAPSPAVIVERLKADPALRFNENGRNLLRLLAGMVRIEDWSRMADGVPPHTRETVAFLARDCARRWTELASDVERNRLRP